MSTFPGPEKAVAAAVAPEASSRLMEVLGVRPRSAARGVMVSRGREREPSVWGGLRWLASVCGVEVGAEICVIVVRKY